MKYTVICPLTRPFIPMHFRKCLKKKYISNSCGPRRNFFFNAANFQRNKMKPDTKGKQSRSLFSLSPSLLKRTKNATCLCIPSLFQLLTLKQSRNIHLNVNKYYFQLPHSTFFFWLNPSKNTAKINFSK